MSKNTSLPITISTAVKQSWEIFKKNWLLLVGLNVIMEVFRNSEKLDSYVGQDTILNLVSLVVSIIMPVVIMSVYLSLVRGQKVTFDKVKNSLGRLWKFWLTTIVFILMVTIGLILFILPGIYVLVNYIFAPYLAFDKQMGPMEAIGEAAKLVKGKWLDTAIYLLLAGLLSISGVIVFGVGIIVTSILGGLSVAILYNKLIK